MSTRTNIRNLGSFGWPAGSIDWVVGDSITYIAESIINCCLLPSSTFVAWVNHSYPQDHSVKHLRKWHVNKRYDVSLENPCYKTIYTSSLSEQQCHFEAVWIWILFEKEYKYTKLQKYIAILDSNDKRRYKEHYVRVVFFQKIQYPQKKNKE